MSLSTRLLLATGGAVLAAFAIVVLAFNVLVGHYVASTATAQLAQGITTISSGDQPSDLPDLSGISPGRFNARPAVFFMDSSYQVREPERLTTQDLEIAQQIAGLLESKKTDPGTVDGVRLRAHGATYYVQSVDQGSAGYAVFFVDVTGIVNFAASVNGYLILIMVVAIVGTVLATLVITRRMTRPLESLTDFSGRIGRGDFTPCTEEFRDRELAILAASMNVAASQLDSYDKDQKVFFQNASHELRTPLMTIRGNAEGIVCGIMDASTASRTIIGETDRLTEMVEDLLTISRIDNITKEHKRVERDVRELLVAAVDEQRGIAENDRLEFGLDLDDEPVTMLCDDTTLRRAFSNLLSNAARYATAAVTLTCRRTDHGVVVEVADDGPGIDPQDLPHIFERFYRGAGGKHGIGLSIVKSVVDQHAGTIDVRSDERGTSFTLTFAVGQG